jgi:hypothetical protein
MQRSHKLERLRALFDDGNFGDHSGLEKKVMMKSASSLRLPRNRRKMQDSQTGLAAWSVIQNPRSHPPCSNHSSCLILERFGLQARMGRIHSSANKYRGWCTHNEILRRWEDTGRKLALVVKEALGLGLLKFINIHLLCEF